MSDSVHSKITQADRDREFSEVVAALRALYQQKTASDSTFGFTNVKLQWKGGVLSQVTITDESTIRPRAASKHSPPDDN
jgi:predicted ATPase